MANKIRLRIVTPVRSMFDEEAEMVIMRGKEGDLGVLAGHIPLSVVLSYGRLRIMNDGKESVATLFGGFAEVTPNQVTILTQAAEWPEEIDVERATKAKERAEQRLKQSDGSVNIERAELALRRALVRLEVSSYPITHVK